MLREAGRKRKSDNTAVGQSRDDDEFRKFESRHENVFADPVQPMV